MPGTGSGTSELCASSAGPIVRRRERLASVMVCALPEGACRCITGFSVPWDVKDTGVKYADQASD